MHGDFSRLIDPRSGPYSAVLAQQGRLLLDAELNEQTSIVLDYLRQLTTDLVGPFAGPPHGAGFDVEPILSDDHTKCRAVRLSPGHSYVYGLRCETPPPRQEPGREIHVGEHSPPLVVYLLVWEQTINAVQAPELVEPALATGIPDTSRRRQVRWRALASKHLPSGEHVPATPARAQIIRAFREHNAHGRRRPLLAARAYATTPAEQTPSTVPAESSYRGVENQLYRVEVHTGGSAEHATFKWSRDNGSVEFALDSFTTDESGAIKATLHRGWRDARSGLEVGDRVELIDDHWAPFGDPQPLLRVHRVSLSKLEIELEPAQRDQPYPAPATRPELHPFLRRWDQRPRHPSEDHAIPLWDAEGDWYELEDGVQVRFEACDAHYERGDYWLIPARTTTPGLLWPHEDPLPPNGPSRYLVPLAQVPALPEKRTDLRVLFAHHEHKGEGEGEGQAPGQGEGEGQAQGHGQGEGEGEGEGHHNHSPAPKAIEHHEEPQPTTTVAPKPSHRLRSISTVLADATFDLREGTMTIGRAPGVDIHIPDDDVSRHQATLTVDGDQLTIVDVGSRNGTWVNDERLAAQTPTELKPGDVIKLSTDAVKLSVEKDVDK